MLSLRPLLALCFGAAALAGCQAIGHDDAPAPACATPATVTLHPSCWVLNCTEHPVLLTLGDGQQLRPQGATWDAYWRSRTPESSDQLLVSYSPLATLTIYTWSEADITCVTEAPTKEPK